MIHLFILRSWRYQKGRKMDRVLSYQFIHIIEQVVLRDNSNQLKWKTINYHNKLPIKQKFVFKKQLNQYAKDILQLVNKLMVFVLKLIWAEYLKLGHQIKDKIFLFPKMFKFLDSLVGIHLIQIVLEFIIDLNQCLKRR